MKIAIFFGGVSGEHEVSLSSAAAVTAALDREKYEPITVGLTREGAWLYTDAPPDAIREDRWRERGVPCYLSPDPTRPGLHLADGRVLRPDLIFSLLHGGAGEDGRMAGLFALSGIPYFGVRTEGAALAMNKALAKTLAAAEGVPVLPHFVTDGRDPDKARREAASLGYPLFVKPLHGGSSVGAGIVWEERALLPALARACVGDAAIVEPYFPAREIEVAILDAGGVTEVSAAGEIAFGGGFYDYENKYSAGRARLSLAELSDFQNTRVRTYAEKVFRALGLSCMARVDFFLSRDTGEIYFNEVNTLPGFTAGSMYPFLLSNGGGLCSLLDRLFSGAVVG